MFSGAIVGFRWQSTFLCYPSLCELLSDSPSYFSRLLTSPGEDDAHEDLVLGIEE